MTKVRLYHDPRSNQPEEIATYLHCGRCMKKLPKSKSPREWARLNVGITDTGAIQVWCVRCDCNVDIIGQTRRPGIDYGDETQRIVPGAACDLCDE